MKRSIIIHMFVAACFCLSCSKMGDSIDSKDIVISIKTKSNGESTVFSAYDYCKKDGFWKQFNSLEGRIAATQVPMDNLENYSTEELLVLCISHPLANIYPAYNHELQAVHVIADRINVFREFETREDAAEVLVNFFSKTTISEKQDSPCLKIDDNYSLSLLNCNFLELYISSARISDVLKGENKEILMENAYRLYNYKKSHSDAYSWFSYGKDLLIVEEIKEGVTSSEGADDLYWKLFRASAPATKVWEDPERIEIDVYGSTTTVNTKCNQQTITADINKEMTDVEYQQVVNDFRDKFPGGIIPEEVRGSITSLYNCHAFAWHMADNNTPAGYYWIIRSYQDMFSDDNLSKYWTDCYYQEVYQESAAEKIYYSGADHSAIKSDITGYYTSKWGLGPLVTHTPSDCPYLMTYMRYFAHTQNCDHDRIDPTPPNPPTPPTPPDQPIDIIPSIGITGNINVRVGQTYTYHASQMYDTALLEWSCSNPSGEISPTNGATVSFTPNDFGTYTLVVEYNMYGIILGRGELLINAEY